MIADYRNRVLSEARKIYKHRDEDAAQDLTQDAMVHLLNAEAQGIFDGRFVPHAYMRTTVINTYLAMYRYTKRRLKIQPVSSEDYDLATEVADKNAVLPEVALIRQENEQNLYAAMEKVKPVFREAIQMYADGLSQVEIAKRLGIKETTVKTRILRARLYLRRRFEGESLL